MTPKKKKKRRTKGSSGLHQQTIDDLVDRLKKKGTYKYVGKNKHYKTSGYDGDNCSMTLEGEFDVIAITKHGRFHYYEVKTGHEPKAYQTALEQFERAATAFPQLTWNFIYVSPYRAKRVRL